MRPSRVSFLAVFLVAACHATPPPSTGASVLPLRSLKLYETGVGYFERSGRLSADGSVVLPVPTAHLDDALKTLVVMGNGQGLSFSGLEFATSLSRGMARSLAGLPAATEEPITFPRLLESMKGSEVRIRLKKASRESVTGRLVDVIVPDGEAEKDRPPLTLLVVTRDGELRRLDAAEIDGVHPTDPALLARLHAALDALGTRGAQTRRALRLLSESNKPITLGYLAETAVWRATYRLVLDTGNDKGRLQGWALVHNDTDEIWSHVKVELVNGQPDSFLYPIAAPRYARRPLAEPEEKLATVPQLEDTTVDQLWGDNLEDGVVTYGHGSGSGSGYGAGGVGVLGGSHKTRAPTIRMGEVTVGSSDALRIGNLAEIAQATGTETGALFSYALARPLDLRAHGSALLPFLSSGVESQRLTWFTEPGERGRSALRFVNTTGQTLPAAPIAIYEGGGFAGEAALDRLSPMQRALLTFGVDLDMELEQVGFETREETRDAYFRDGVLVEDFLREGDRRFELVNRALSPRTAYLTLDIVSNADVKGADALDYDVAGEKPLAVFRVDPGKRVPRTLHVREALQRSSSMEQLTAKRVKELAAVEALPAPARAVLKEAGARLDEAEAKAKEHALTKASVAELEGDLTRLREHLSALGDKSGPGAGANPLVQRILAAEDRLAMLRTKLATLEASERERRDAGKAVLAKLEPPPHS